MLLLCSCGAAFNSACTGEAPTRPSVDRSQSRSQHQQTAPRGIHQPPPVRGLDGPGEDSIAPIVYHGGKVLPTTNIVAIYWSNSTIYTGGPAPGTGGPGSNDNSLVGFFLNHFGGSPNFNVNTTYYDTVGVGHTVSNVLNYTAYWADNQNVPPTNGDTVTDAVIEAEIERGFSSGAITYDSLTLYVVFSSGGTNLGGGFQLPFDSLHYCGYHTHFNWSGHIVRFAALPYNAYGNLCSHYPSPNNDLPADAEINSLAHEIDEAATDPDINAWYDSYSTNPFSEDGDKCAWSWGTMYNDSTANMNIAGKDFLIQRIWNRATQHCAQNLGHSGFYVTSLSGAPSTITAPGYYTLVPALSIPPSGPVNYSWVVTSSNNVIPKDSTGFRPGGYTVNVPAGDYYLYVTVMPSDVLGPGAFATQIIYPVCTTKGGNGPMLPSGC